MPIKKVFYLKLILGVLIISGFGCASKNSSAPSESLTTVPAGQTVKAAESFQSLKLLNSSKLISIIAFGSCADQKKPTPLFKEIVGYKPDLYIGAGDNVYSSSEQDRPISKAYYTLSAIPEFQELAKTTPIIATWDDHDFGINDGGATNADKLEARDTFLKFFTNDAPMINEKYEGVYHSFLLGPIKKQVQVILLDTRWSRSELETNTNPKSSLDKYQPTKDKNKVFLSAAQWKWLEAELAKKADLRILVSSVQLVADENGFEKWSNFPAEKEKLLKLLTKYKINNLVVISGDRHAGEISKLPRKGLSDLIDITASGINRTSTIAKEENRFRVGKRTVKENFGLFLIDWEKRQLDISLMGIENQLIDKTVFQF